MGALASRQNVTAEQADVALNYIYKYPPRSGNFFGSHFIMGGERFDTPQPEAYLFGENADLNFLGSRPTAFPYPPPQSNEPTKTLKSLVNIRKESVRFVRVQENEKDFEKSVKIIQQLDETTVNGQTQLPSSIFTKDHQGSSFNIEFIFDSDAKCCIKIYYFCTEEVSPSGVTFYPRDSLTSETYHYNKGINQYFSQPSHVLNPNLFCDDDFTYNPAKQQYPVAIHCVIEEGAGECRQSHTTICVIDHHADNIYVLRALKQKIFVDGLCYLLQEIYGIENKAVTKSTIDDETDDHGSECVICMSETRDTLILPCRHLCLCNSCADSLRYQANNCPICRAPFRALLQVRAVQKGVSSNLLAPQTFPDPPCDQHVPSGYIPVPLIEALNGPLQFLSRIQNTENDATNLPMTKAAENSNDSTKVDFSGKQNSPQKTGSQMRSVGKKNFNTNNGVSNSLPEFSMPVIDSTSNHDQRDVNDNARASKSSSPSTRTSVNNDRTNIISKDDSLQIVNERNNSQLKKETAANESVKGGDHEDDSDNENLSLLLARKTKDNLVSSALHIDGVDESVDNTDTEGDEIKSNKKKRNRPALSADGEGCYILTGAEDSDYYTPEDPHTTILSLLCPEKLKSGEQKTKDIASNLKNSFPKRSVYKKSTSTGNIMSPASLSTLRGNVISLPDMLDGPSNGNSTSIRSSSDSYSSSSSTKQLLVSNNTTSATNIILDDKIALHNAVNV